MNTMDIDEKPRRLTESEIFDAEGSQPYGSGGGY